MPKAAPDVFIDGSLLTIKNNVTRIVVTSGEPSNFSAVAALTLGSSDHSLSTPNTATAPTDFLISDDISGRKVDIPARAGIYCSAAGNITHVCVTSATVLYYVTTCTSQAVVVGNKVSTPTWKVSIPDPV